MKTQVAFLLKDMCACVSVLVCVLKCIWKSKARITKISLEKINENKGKLPRVTKIYLKLFKKRLILQKKLKDFTLSRRML